MTHRRAQIRVAVTLAVSLGLLPPLQVAADVKESIMVSESAAAPRLRTYTTRFRRAENPIAEAGKWINGRADGLDWADVRTRPGLAYGLEAGTIKYDDATALLKGPWRPDQSAEAVVHTVNQTESCFEEVEIRLRSAISSSHKATGYEILFRCLKTGKAYCQIVRWNGPLGNFTYLNAAEGARFGVADGDVVRANMVGNVITAYKNGEKLLEAKDDTYAEGSPGMGFYLEGVGGKNEDYGFTRFTAKEE